MKKILYLIFVALFAVTSGTAWGQTNPDRTLGNIPTDWTVKVNGSSVTVTDGTAAIPAGATVTLTPLYPAKVKSVKLKDEGLLNGKFSISATNQVYFSQGNLQATYNGSAWSWAFATNQWDYIGNAEGNTKLTATTPFVSDYTGTSTTVDLFGWVGASSTWEGAAQYGITSSTEQSGGADGYGNIVSESLKSDWGTLAITNGGNAANNGWRTLTIDEWEWILGPVYSSDPYYPSPSPNPGVNCRTSSTVGGTANARYAKATVADKPGLIIFPDSYTHPSDVTAPTNVNTYNADYTHNSYDATAWGKMESAGAVFLPAAGFRSGVTVNNAGLSGDYWSSSSKSDVPQSAYRVWLSSTILDPRYYSLRNNGSSVRLVKDAQIVNLSTLTGDYEAQNGDILINTLAGNYKITIADGATVTLRNATINGTNNNSYQWAGITCLGDATIVLEGTNNVKGFYHKYPGIQAAHNGTGSGNEYTLTIMGTGALNASSNGYAPGIGGGYVLACGNIAIESGTITSTGSGGGAGIGGGSSASCGNITISGGTIEATGSGSSAGIGSGSGHNPGDTYGEITISGGTITATGGQYGAGIGSGSSSYWGNINITGGTVIATGGELAAGIGCGNGYSNPSYTCGNISITGGTVTATGGSLAAGIGSGRSANCGTVTITDGVTQVTAIKGVGALNSIGKGSGDDASCGTITIGGTVYYQNNDYVGTGSTYLTQSSLGYPVKAAAQATAGDLGKVIGANGCIYDDAAAATAAGTTAVALICYVGAAGSADESTGSETYKGLALALADANDGNGTVWCSQSSVPVTTCMTVQYYYAEDAIEDMVGIANTDYLIDHVPVGHTHTAAYVARNYNGGTHPIGTSAWFLPSAGQWYKMLTAFGGFESLRTNASLQSADYRSSTESNAPAAHNYNFLYGYWSGASKNYYSNCFVRSVIAF